MEKGDMNKALRDIKKLDLVSGPFRIYLNRKPFGTQRWSYRSFKTALERYWVLFHFVFTE